MRHGGWNSRVLTVQRRGGAKVQSNIDGLDQNEGHESSPAYVPAPINLVPVMIYTDGEGQSGESTVDALDDGVGCRIGGYSPSRRPIDAQLLETGTFVLVVANDKRAVEGNLAGWNEERRGVGRWTRDGREAGRWWWWMTVGNG